MNEITPFFDFLKYCLEYKGNMSRVIAGMGWQKLYSFASKQALLGLCFEGIERLGKEYPEELKRNPIRRKLLMNWMGKAQQIRRQNMKVNAVAVMYVLHETLGLSEEKMIAPIDKKRGKLLLAEILNGGNFGKRWRLRHK